MLSKKSKYAIKALLYLAQRREEGSPVLATEIAEREKIPRKFLEAILLELKNAGILRSKRGRKGGYFLCQDPGEVNLAQIMRLFDGPIALLPCVSENYYKRCDECQDEVYCGIRAVFLEIRSKSLEVLLQNTLDKILATEEKLAETNRSRKTKDAGNRKG